MPPDSLSTGRVGALGQVGDLERAVDRGAALVRAARGTGARTRRGSGARSARRRGCRAAARRRTARAPAWSRFGTSNPSTWISPASAIACAVSIFIVVDLPAPFGPSSPTHVPSGTSRSRPSTAVISPKRLTTPRRRIARGADMGLPSMTHRAARPRSQCTSASRCSGIAWPAPNTSSGSHSGADRAQSLPDRRRVAARSRSGSTSGMKFG